MNSQKVWRVKFFIDTAEITEIADLVTTGLVDGVTTNPSLIAKSNRPILDTIKEICRLVDGPVSAEIVATDLETMLAEGYKLAKLADNVVIKVPLTVDGLKACRQFSKDKIGVNVTLCFSTGQALLAAKSGASFISPFVGRLDDIGQDGMGLISDILEVFNNYDFGCQVLVASVRNPNHVIDAARYGAHVVTLPPSILRALYKHPLTDKGLQAFLADWKKTGQKIL